MKIQKITLWCLSGLVGAGLLGLGLTSVQAEPEKKTDPKTEPKKLTGAELYAINCARCHPERYPTEFNSGQWQTIMLHMRVRANLPAAQAREILKYLKENARH
jgi:mono/diheme cytochrome c family protein